MKKLIAISVISVVIAACDTSERVEADYRNVIPLPHEIVMVDGNSFVVEKDTRIPLSTAFLLFLQRSQRE